MERAGRATGVCAALRVRAEATELGQRPASRNVASIGARVAEGVCVREGVVAWSGTGVVAYAPAEAAGAAAGGRGAGGSDDDHVEHPHPVVCVVDPAFPDDVAVFATPHAARIHSLVFGPLSLPPALASVCDASRLCVWSHAVPAHCINDWEVEASFDLSDFGPVVALNWLSDGVAYVRNTPGSPAHAAAGDLTRLATRGPRPFVHVPALLITLATGSAWLYIRVARKAWSKKSFDLRLTGPIVASASTLLPSPNTLRFAVVHHSLAVSVYDVVLSTEKLTRTIVASLTPSPPSSRVPLPSTISHLAFHPTNPDVLVTATSAPGAGSRLERWELVPAAPPLHPRLASFVARHPAHPDPPPPAPVFTPTTTVDIAPLPAAAAAAAAADAGPHVAAAADSLASTLTSLAYSPPLWQSEAASPPAPAVSLAVGLGSGAVLLFDDALELVAELADAEGHTLAAAADGLSDAPAATGPTAKKRKVLRGSPAAVGALLAADVYRDPPGSVVDMAWSHTGAALVVLDASYALRFYPHAASVAVALDAPTAPTALSQLYSLALSVGAEFWDVSLLVRSAAAASPNPSSYIDAMLAATSDASSVLPPALARMFDAHVHGIRMALHRMVGGRDAAVVDERAAVVLAFVVDVFESCATTLATVDDALAFDLDSTSLAAPSFTAVPDAFVAAPAPVAPASPRPPKSPQGHDPLLPPPSRADPLRSAALDTLAHGADAWPMDEYTGASLVPLIEWVLNLGLFLLFNLQHYAAAPPDALPVPLLSFLAPPPPVLPPLLATLRKALLIASVLLNHPAVKDGAGPRLPWQCRSTSYVARMYMLVTRIHALTATYHAAQEPIPLRTLAYILRPSLVAPLLPSSSTDLNQWLLTLELFPPLLGVLDLAPLSDAEPASASSSARKRPRASDAPHAATPTIDATATADPSPVSTAAATDVVSRKALTSKPSAIVRQCNRCHSLSEVNPESPSVLWYSSWLMACPCGGRWRRVVTADARPPAPSGPNPPHISLPPHITIPPNQQH